METILVAGCDSVVGANLAAEFSRTFQVVGLSFSRPLALPDCETACCRADDIKSVRGWIQATRPERVVYCGEASQSSWQAGDDFAPGRAAVDAARVWARAAREGNCRLAVVSSDAVFTGPWMFHKENSTCLCESVPAGTIRSIEQLALRLCPGTLVVRTNAYGWTPDVLGPGWIETILEELQLGTAGPFDFLRHGTPILASDLAGILGRAWEKNLDGVFHVAGAERVNPNRFVERLADEFGLPSPLPVEGNTLIERPAGFGRGETSLHTGRIRKALGIAMPALGESLQRLREQKHNGYCDRLNAAADVYHDQVA